jgi:hypothetical protein
MMKAVSGQKGDRSVPDAPDRDGRRGGAIRRRGGHLGSPVQPAIEAGPADNRDLSLNGRAHQPGRERLYEAAALDPLVEAAAGFDAPVFSLVLPAPSPDEPEPEPDDPGPDDPDPESELVLEPASDFELESERAPDPTPALRLSVL